MSPAATTARRSITHRLNSIAPLQLVKPLQFPLAATSKGAALDLLQILHELRNNLEMVVDDLVDDRVRDPEGPRKPFEIGLHGAA